MKHVLLSAALAVLLTGCLPSSGRAPQYLGKKVPPVRVQNMGGGIQPISSVSSKDKVVIFWATWCHFSRPVMEKLNEMAESGKYDKYDFIAVSIDEKDRAPVLHERIKYTDIKEFKHTFSGRGVYDESYRVLSGGTLPHVLVIDKFGRLVAEGHDEGVLEELVN